MQKKSVNQIDVVLVGAGIMSATLATLLHELNPQLKIHLYEKLPACGQESSEVLNNAGTGHAGNCELNYTPEKNGVIDIHKALSINEMFELSLQFWSYVVKKNKIIKPQTFISKSSHASFVWDKKNVDFLKKRFNKIKEQPLFKGITFTDNYEEIKKKFPLLIRGRKKLDDIALTNYENGTDVNFGNLTNILISELKKQNNFKLHLSEPIQKITKIKDGYLIKSKTGMRLTKFIFLGAGGNSIKILQNLKIKESFGYGGFPISGKWLICNNQNIVKQHQGKVYSQAETGAPPMSVPHLDIRKIGNQDCLLFGPFAGFTFKFLKNGSFLDFPKSIKLTNFKEILTVCIKNLNLVNYLFKQIILTHEKRMHHLRKFYPNAKSNDWKLIDAGQRVQIIKPSKGFSGKLEFGTEIIYDDKKTLAALLGASPGASVSAASMLEIIEKCFAHEIPNFNNKIRRIFPSYQIELNKQPKKLEIIRKNYRRILKLS